MNDIRAHVDRKAWNESVVINFSSRGPGDTLRAAEQLTFVEIPQGAQPPFDCVTLQDGEAQQLVDELWRVGFRPSEDSGSAGALAATERHLKDLQRLVFEFRIQGQ